ncbi:hypothetical protein HF086_003220 [Spodoptera exigua]|uniref:Uncharacterized protein n=1 Tax=Spodoptera exigua TaxID=7107 RepID=A0A922MR95_SPOEX|nr:hypothetical protein HF086_003220 [Spodoptera exigua]
MKLFAKTSHDDNNMIEIDFLKTKLIKQSAIPEPERNQNARGITQERKTGIIRKLGDIIPPNRLLFWENLPVNDESVDLTATREPQE